MVLSMPNYVPNETQNDDVPHIVKRVLFEFCPKIANIARMLEQVINYEGHIPRFRFVVEAT